MTEASLRSRAATALRWSIAGRLITQVISWASTLVVIRLLAPQDYGLMAMAMGIISFAILFNTMGANAVIIRNKDLSDDEIGSLQGLVAVLNLGLGALIFLAAPVASHFYGTDVTTILRVCCLVFVSYAISVVQESLLIRALDFKSRTLAESTGQVAGALAALALAWLGAGVWALVISMITIRSVTAIGFLYVVKERFAWRLNWGDLRPHAGYASAMLVQRLLGWWPQNFTAVVIGAMRGPEQLGIYYVAQTLAFLPTAKFGGSISQVSFATYALSQERQDGVANALRKSLSFIAFVLFPYSIIGAAWMPVLLPIVLGETWRPAVLSVQLFLLALPFHTMNFQLTIAANASGDAGLALSARLVAAALTTALVIAGGAISVEWAAGGWLVATPVAHFIMIAIINRAVPIRIGALLLIYAKPVAVGVAAALAAVALQTMTISGYLYLDIAIQLVASLAVGTALAFVLDRERFKDIIAFAVKG